MWLCMDFFRLILFGETGNQVRWEEEAHWSLRLIPMRWLLTGRTQSQERVLRLRTVVLDASPGTSLLTDLPLLPMPTSPTSVCIFIISHLFLKNLPQSLASPCNPPSTRCTNLCSFPTTGSAPRWSKGQGANFSAQPNSTASDLHNTVPQPYTQCSNPAGHIHIACDSASLQGHPLCLGGLPSLSWPGSRSLPTQRRTWHQADAPKGL